MRCLGIIPARGGSKGLPGKNVAPICGKPVIAYVMEAALAAWSLDRVVVSTDSEEIAAIANNHEVSVIDRPAEFANDTAPIDQALRHATRECEKSDGQYDIVVWMQANVPTLRTAVIDRVTAALIDSKADSAATVVPYEVPPQWAWRLDGDRMMPLEGCYNYSVLRQDAVLAYHLDGAVNAFRRDILLNTEGQAGQSYFGTDRRAVVQDPHDSIEIDDAFDLTLAEFLIRRRSRTETGG